MWRECCFVNKFIEKLRRAARDAETITKLADDIARDYKDHMREGRWILLWYEKPLLICAGGKGRAFYRSIYKKQQEMVSLKIIIRSHLLNLLCSRWKFSCPNDGKKAFRADCIIFSRTNSLYFCDLTEKRVKKNYANKNSVQGYWNLKRAGYWKVFFSPVESIKGDTVYEKFLQTRKEDNLSESEKYASVLKKYKEYFGLASPVAQYTMDEIVSQYREIIPHFADIFTPDILSITIRYYYLHGDFKNDNSFWNSLEEISVIDYELAGLWPFFQDIIYWSLHKNLTGRGAWNMLDSIVDEKSEHAMLFNDILNAQGIPTDRKTKIALCVVTALGYLQIRMKMRKLIWNPKDTEDDMRESAKRNIHKIFIHFYEKK